MIELILLFCLDQGEFCEKRIMECYSTGTSIEFCVGDYVLNREQE